MAETLEQSWRVAMIGQKGYPPIHGGIEKHVAELAARLPDRGISVDIYSRPHYSKLNGPADLPGVTVRRLPSLATKHLDAISHTVVSTFDTVFRKPDLVHYHALGPGLLAGLPRWMNRIPTVVTVHGLDWQRDKWGTFARWVLRLGESASVKFPDRTIVVSRSLQKYYENNHHRRPDFIPNGVAVPESRPPGLLQQRGIERKFILFVGRLVPEKGCHLLLNAWRDLAPDLRAEYLVIAGGAGFTPRYVDELKRAAPEDVVFLGYVHGPLLEEAYSQAELVVLPSTLEGLSITLLEGMSYGRCCLVSDIPPNLEASAGHAVVFASGNVGDLAAQLVSILQDPERRSFLGGSGRRHVREQYSWEKVADSTADLYRQLMVG